MTILSSINESQAPIGLTKSCADWCRESWELTQHYVDNSGITFIAIAALCLSANYIILNWHKQIAKGLCGLEGSDLNIEDAENMLAKLVPWIDMISLILLLGFVIYRFWYLKV